MNADGTAQAGCVSLGWRFELNLCHLTRLGILGISWQQLTQNPAYASNALPALV